MILWDDKGKKQLIRTKGTIRVDLSDKDFSNIKTKDGCEKDAKVKVDGSIAIDGYHAYIHIYEQADDSTAKAAQYVTWLGPINQEPKKDWWLGDPPQNVTSI
jgi:hypothetical protein